MSVVTSDSMGQRLFDAFFSEEHMPATIVILSENVQQRDDRISYVISLLLTSKIKIQLIANGLLLFQGNDLMIPYQHMLPHHRDCILCMMQEHVQSWTFYECSLVWKGTLPSVLHDEQLRVLKALCSLVQSTSKVRDERSKLAIMNIILQRVHSKVCLSKPVQLLLNKHLFEVNNDSQEKPI